jgi:hypothetical protein
MNKLVLCKTERLQLNGCSVAQQDAETKQMVHLLIIK